MSTDVPALASSRLSAAEERMSLREVLDILGQSRWLIAAMIAIGTLAAAAASWIATPRYEARVLMSAVTDQSSRAGLGSALGSAMSQLGGGVSALAGLGLSAPEAKAEAVATLQSEALTEKYIQDQNLLPVLYSKEWDNAQQKWKTHDPDDMPSIWKANQYFGKRIRTVDTSGKTGLITLTIVWKDPKQAAQWANDLVRLTNEYMRDNAIRESDRNIAYLDAQAAKSNVVELRTAIYQLMESEIKKEMIARGSDQYALKVIDPATVPEKKSYPLPLLWISGGFVGGLVLGVFAAVVRRSIRRL